LYEVKVVKVQGKILYKSFIIYLASLNSSLFPGFSTPIYIHSFAANTFSQPAAITVDPLSGKIFVLDTNVNNATNTYDIAYSFQSTGSQKRVHFLLPCGLQKCQD